MHFADTFNFNVDQLCLVKLRAYFVVKCAAKIMKYNKLTNTKLVGETLSKRKQSFVHYFDNGSRIFNLNYRGEK